MNPVNNFASGLLAGRRAIYRPPLTIAQRVIDTIVANVQRYETETGEALIGLALPSAGANAGVGGRSAPEPDLVVLGTIAPDASAVRTGIFFEQGDDLQSDTLNWLADNWNDAHKTATDSKADSKADPRWNAPLIHLGDWHKHPGTLVEPSPGDANTAVDLIYDRDIQRPYILAILATLWNKAAAQKAIAELAALPNSNGISNGTPLLIDLPDDPTIAVRIDCWYLSRQTRIFVRLSPMVQPDAALPALPLVGWHLTDPKRMWRECNALLDAGYAVQIDERDTDGKPPREICLTVTKGQHTWIIVTPADYPHHAPHIRRISSESSTGLADPPTFAELWAHSALLPDPVEWRSDRLLIDLIKV